MHIGVAYAGKFKRTWLKLDVPEGSTVREAIEHAGLLTQYPEIDLSVQEVGIFGKIVELDTQVNAGDRVEIYRPSIADPKTAVQRER
ncbi:MAG: RnfH family protein [Chromatiaceae bacterium]|nr:MAG: RnfH family protein [Chromatiaceae bacterium]